MIFKIFRPDPQADMVAGLYGVIVAQARRPVFYRDYGVPDTVNGRFEMVMLHTLLFLWQLDRAKIPGGEDLGQAIFDRFCLDMDSSLREMGIGDLGVPRQMKKVGQAFYGRLQVLSEALVSDDHAALSAMIGRAFDVEAHPAVDVPRFTAYALAAAATPFEPGRSVPVEALRFPDPAEIVVAVS